MTKQKIQPIKEFREYTLPSVIKIGYQDIKISEADFLDGEQGLYSADRSEIRLKQGIEGREALNTMLHEVMHAIVYSYGMKHSFKDGDHEEKIVNALGNGLTETLVRNQALAKWVFENAK